MRSRTARPGRVVVVGRGEPERGGIPSFLAMLVDAQEALGREVVLVNLSEGARREGGRASWSNLTRTFTDALRVLRTARSGDVVHVHSALAPTVTCVRAGLLLRAARLRGARTVLHAHGGRIVGSLTSPARRAVTRISLRPADAVIAVSVRVRDTLVEAGLDPARVRHLPNGVDVDRFADAVRPASRPHDPPRVLFVGGITARKGVLDLLEASSTLLAEGVAHEVRLVGGVPDEGERSHDEVRDALPPQAVMVGPVDPADIPAAYDGADVFCLPSWWEAMPLTVLEAQAAGLPVVASDVGDVATMVQDGVTGRLVPPRDPAALADALRPLLSDTATRRRMGEAGQERMRENFDVARLLGRLGALFDEVLGRAGEGES